MKMNFLETLTYFLILLTSANLLKSETSVLVEFLTIFLETVFLKSRITKTYEIKSVINKISKTHN